MFKTVMLVLYILLIGVLMWFPGFMCARRMVVACSEREPTVGETILAAIPFLNLGVGRTQLHGSAKLVWITAGVVAVLMALKMMFFFWINNSFGVLASLIITFALLAACVLVYIVQAYVLFDMAVLLQYGTLVKIVAFICPPLACYFIGRDCVAHMRGALDSDEGEFA